uniref:ATP-grasp domain-containing protein n=1 Tax=Flavobacterium sp. TaxID=239 RepID=UPI0040497082
MNVFITSIGSNTSIAVIKALKKQVNIDVRIIGGDLNDRIFCAGAAHVDVFVQTPSVFQKHEYETALFDIIETYSIDCVIAIHDYEISLISEFKAKYPSHTFWAVNDMSIIDICNDKLKTNTFANSLGINVPQFKPFADSVPEDIKEKLLIAKPINGVSSSGIYTISNVNDFYYVRSRVVIDNYFIQEMVKGTEYTVDCYSGSDSKFYGGVVRERVETKSGISVKGRIVDKKELIDYSAKMLNSLGYIGASNVQFISNEYGDYFIELNPRFSGAGILSYIGGFNSPLYTLQEAAGTILPPFETSQVKLGLTMTRFWDEIFYDAKGNII